MRSRQIKMVLMAIVVMGSSVGIESGLAVPVRAEEQAEVQAGITDENPEDENVDILADASAENNVLEFSEKEENEDAEGSMDERTGFILEEENAMQESRNSSDKEILDIPLRIEPQKYVGQPDPDLTENLREQITAALERQEENPLDFAADSTTDVEETVELLLAGIHWEYEEAEDLGEDGEYRPAGESLIRFTFACDEQEENPGGYRFVLNGDVDNREAVLTTRWIDVQGEALTAYRVEGLEAGPEGSFWGRESSGVTVMVKDSDRWKISADEPGKGEWADSVTWNDPCDVAEHRYYLRDLSPEGNGAVYPAFTETFGIRASAEASSDHTPDESDDSQETGVPQGVENETGTNGVTGQYEWMEDDGWVWEDEQGVRRQEDTWPEERDLEGLTEEKDNNYRAENDETEALGGPEGDRENGKIERNADPVIAFIGMETARPGTTTELPGVVMAGGDPNAAEVRLYRILPDGTEEDVTDMLGPKNMERADGTLLSPAVLDQVRENDGVYRISVDYRNTDGTAQRVAESEFTVNHFGSVYEIGREARKLQGACVKKVAKNLVITEYNPDTLVEGSRRVEITRDGDVLQNVRYSVKERIDNTKVEDGGASTGWHAYDYVIDASNFRKDGIYRVVVSSEDEAGNHPESQTDRSKEVRFRVDATPPEFIRLTLPDMKETGKNAGNGNMNIQYEAFDAMGLKSVEVLSGQKSIFRKTKFTDAARDSGSVPIPEEYEGKEIAVVLTDGAGNTAERKIIPRASTGGGLHLTTWIRKAGFRRAVILLIMGLLSAGGISAWMWNRRRKYS